MSGKSLMHGNGESHNGVVAAKQPNKSEASPAEVVEERPLTKENTPEPNPYRTPSRESGSNGLQRVREAARQDKKLKFTALLHHVSSDLLRQSYYSLKKQAAPGVDGMTWEEYGQDLEARLADLQDESIVERIERSRHAESGFPKPMEGNDHWGLRPWKTKSFSTRWERFSTRFGKRTFWASVTVSGRGAASTMHWTRCGSGLCARK